MPLQVLNVSNSFDCAWKCIEVNDCFSFNLALILFGGAKQCQLLPTDKYKSPQHLNTSKNFEYYSVSLGVGQGNHAPCKNGGQIQPFYWTGKYECICPTGTDGMHCEWLKSNTYALKVEPKGTKFGKFYAPHSGVIKRFKLVHVSGGLTCWHPHWPLTNFGCAYYTTELLCMMITDTNNNVVSPPQSLYSEHDSKCYTISGVSKSSKELILPDVYPPLNVAVGQELRVWYSEDLFKILESDNYGTLYTDVYIEYVA